MAKEPHYKKLERMEKLIYRDTMYATDTASAAVKNSINSIYFRSTILSTSHFSIKDQYWEVMYEARWSNMA